jgi:hypothetical protein
MKHPSASSLAANADMLEALEKIVSVSENSVITNSEAISIARARGKT